MVYGLELEAAANLRGPRGTLPRHSRHHCELAHRRRRNSGIL